jgi:hypothetical protein
VIYIITTIAITALDAAIDEILEGMSDEQCADPRFYPDNYPAWNAFFR